MDTQHPTHAANVRQLPLRDPEAAAWRLIAAAAERALEIPLGAEARGLVSRVHAGALDAAGGVC